MNKILFAITAALLTMPLTTSAMVKSQHLIDDQLNLTYPVVYVANKDIQEKINHDIASEVYALKGKVDNGKYDKASSSYDVTYEDDSVVSIAMRKEFVSAPNATDGYAYYVGLVYDKKTGEKLPLSYFVHIKNVQQLADSVMTGLTRQTNIDGTETHYYYDDVWRVKSISEEYVLIGNGALRLLYAPYELGPYAAGPLNLEITRDGVEYFNALNTY